MMSFLTFLFVMYWLPTIIAVVRGIPALGIATFNFFLGWTVIGWIVALVLALAGRPQERIVIIEGRAREVR